MVRKLGDYRMPFETKKIVVYGQGRIKVPVKQRYWIKRKFLVCRSFIKGMIRKLQKEYAKPQIKAKVST